MKKPEIPDCEELRIQDLRSLALLDTKPEETFEAVTKLVKHFFDVPICAISLVDRERQWFKSIQGLDVCETGRDVSFCGHTILQEGIFFVEDTLKDKRFCDNPLVVEEPKIRFYAGYPLKSSAGHAIGTLCIIDTKPRHISKEKLSMLKDFVLLIESEIFEKRKSSAYLGVISKIQEMHINGDSQVDLFNEIMIFLLNHTASEQGFIAEVFQHEDNKESLKLHAVTSGLWVDEIKQLGRFESINDLVCKDLDELLVLSKQSKKITTGSDLKNDPIFENMSPVFKSFSSYLGVPIYGKSGLIAVYGLANRRIGYDVRTVESLLAITKVMSSIIESLKNINTIDLMSKKDVLTDTYNRSFFKKHVENIISKSERGDKFCLLMIDIDNFKIINDFYGHLIGDGFLKGFIKRVSPLLKKTDFIARIGGDEFVVVLNNLKKYTDAGLVSERILETSKEPYEINGKTVNGSVSIGLVSYPLSATTYDSLMQYVDLALYESKKTKGVQTFYSKNLDVTFKERLKIEKNIKRGLQNKEFYCVYQPQVDVRTNKIIGIEALLRWNFGSASKEILPKKFISVIEEMDLATELNEYVLNQVLDDCSALAGFNEPLKIAVNISFSITNFKDSLMSLLRQVEEASISDHLRLEFEVTEESVIRTDGFQYSDLKEIMKLLKDSGISLAIDDFGIKHSSINRLIDYDFKTIKIDKSFIDKINSDQSQVARAIINAVVGLSKELGLKVIAEGVESENQALMLQEHGCFVIQGFYFFKPMSIKEVAKLLR